MIKLATKLFTVTLFAGLCLWLTGCALDTIDTRKHEKWMTYGALPQDQRDMVDVGKIRIGMSTDAVYIAWGKPQDVTENETAEGRTSAWVYHGSWAQQTQYWSYREIKIGERRELERYLETDWNPRNYIRAEVVFFKGKVIRWNTNAKPVN